VLRNYTFRKHRSEPAKEPPTASSAKKRKSKITWSYNQKAYN